MTQKRLLLTLFLALLTPLSQAALENIPYYPDSLIELRHQESEQLREMLHRTLNDLHLKREGQRDLLVLSCPEEGICQKQRADLSYREARLHLFGELHLREDQTLRDVYCQRDWGAADGVGPWQIPDHQKVNCEHSWPQSKFNRRHSTELQKTDLHHLYPVESRSNSSRGNISFGEVKNTSTSLCQASSRGPALHFDTVAFEPPDQHKGDVARAMFYFSIRYETEIAAHEEFYLRLWHEQDPVDEWERERHEQIYRIQFVRNPFIDDPALVDEIENF